MRTLFSKKSNKLHLICVVAWMEWLLCREWQKTSMALLGRLVLSLAVGAASNAYSAPNAVDVANNEPELALSRQLQTLEDPRGQLTLGTLLAEPQAWHNNATDSLNFGFSHSAWWVRIGLSNTNNTTVTTVLDLGTPLQDEVDMHIVRADNRSEKPVLTGDRRPFNTRPILMRIPNLPIVLGPGERLEVYLKLVAHDGLHEPMVLKLWRPNAYATHMQTETTVLGIYYGALITVLLYNLFLYISTRDRGFGLYTLYITAFFVWSFTFRGFAFQYWWPNSPVLNNQILPLGAAACFFTFGLFITHYLDTRHSVAPWLHNTLIGTAWGSLLSVTPAFFNFYALPFVLSTPLEIVMMGVAMIAGIDLMRRGSKPARYYLIAFTLLAVGVVLYYLRVLDLVASNAITENFLQIGSALEVLLLAFGLADQMNTLKADKLKAEREALASQTVLNTALETLVSSRTAALESANQRLADLAITDALTQAYNRRHFDTCFELEVARHSRHRTPLAFCMLDIDNFKSYNDHYGHPAGDEILKQTSKVLRGLLNRTGDQLFRVGGEEFAFLLTVDAPLEKAHAFVDHLRLALERLSLPHAGNPTGVITASFGLVLLQNDSPTTNTTAVYALADKLLYEAKHAGRNRVMCQAL